MAKCNFIFLYGQVIKKPQIVTDADGVISKGALDLRVIRRKEVGRSLEGTAITIMTANSGNLEIIKNLRKGDMCVVKGVMTTANINKGQICTCGHTNEQIGSVSFVTPIHIEKREALSEIYKDVKDPNSAFKTEGDKLLLANHEISNIVHLIGTLVRPPEYYISPDNRHQECSYQIAVNRRFRIIDSGIDIRTDYPWIRTYGELAAENAEVLDTNSTVFIDGYLFRKIVKRETFCQSCGAAIEITEHQYEVRPYAVEYLHNCNLPDKKYLE